MHPASTIKENRSFFSDLSQIFSTFTFQSGDGIIFACQGKPANGLEVVVTAVISAVVTFGD
jgi:hypothetical protein